MVKEAWILSAGFECSELDGTRQKPKALLVLGVYENRKDAVAAAVADLKSVSNMFKLSITDIVGIQSELRNILSDEYICSATVPALTGEICQRHFQYLAELRRTQYHTA